MQKNNNLSWEEFIKLDGIKHNADLQIGDVVLVDDQTSPCEYETKNFIRAVIDSYCGDDFSGYVEDTGKRIGCRRNVDLYKIVGKCLNITSNPRPISID